MKHKKGDTVRVASRTLLHRTQLLLLEADPKNVKKSQDLFVHLGSVLFKEPMIGKVVKYGARREGRDDLYVGVRLKNKYGKLTEICYFGSEQLKRV